MGKIRLYSLAKELGLESKELIVKLRSKGVVVKSPLSSVDETVEAAARRIILGTAAVTPPATKAPATKEKSSSARKSGDKALAKDSDGPKKTKKQGSSKPS